MKFERILIMSFFAFLCWGALFLKIESFVDVYIVPKWLFSLMLIGIIADIWGVSILLKRQLICSLKDVFIVVICMCIFQAGYGMLQFCNILSSHFTLHRVTGSFDNSAGFAGCLCAGIPFCLYFLRTSSSKKRQWIIQGILIFLFITVCLSQSRAGIISVSATLMIYFLYRNNLLRKLKMGVLLIGICILFISCYYLKKDSADGRFLIWQCAWEMIKDKPLFGHGAGAFEAHYMDYQARYFAEHPVSKFFMLADNVKQVFNEYLSIGIQFGVVGWLVMCILIVFLVRCYQKAPSLESWVSGLSLIGIGIFACFSYPFTYPFVWIVALLNVVLLVYNGYSHCLSFITETVRIPLVIILFTCSSILVHKVYLRTRAELAWGEIARRSLDGQTIEMLPRYRQLISQLGDVPYYLYNYAAELYVAGYYDASLKIAKQCRKYWADYDLELLQGEIQCKLGRKKEAEQHYILASQMCPVRFIPLYNLYEIYKSQGHADKVQQLAQQILHKPIKVNSFIIRNIKRQVSLDN